MIITNKSDRDVYVGNGNISVEKLNPTESLNTQTGEKHIEINNKDYKFIYQKMGLDSRLNKLKEELGECLVAACHLQDNKVKAGDLIEEMGDVALLIYQIVDILDAEKEFQNCIDYKKVNFCDKFGGVE